MLSDRIPAPPDMAEGRAGFIAGGSRFSMSLLFEKSMLLPFGEDSVSSDTGWSISLMVSLLPNTL